MESREKFKSVSKYVKNNYRNQETLKLLRARESNAKAYWNLLKGNKTRSKSTVTLTDFKQYFEKLSNLNDPFYQADAEIKTFNEEYDKTDFGDFFELLNVPFSCEELKQCTEQLKTGKSGREDNMFN